MYAKLLIWGNAPAPILHTGVLKDRLKYNLKIKYFLSVNTNVTI